MKSFIFAASALVACVSGRALPDDPKPMGAGHGHGGGPPMAPAGIKVDKMTSLFSPDNQRVRVTYGTYTLKGFNETTGGHGPMSHEGGMNDASNKKAPKPCEDCTLKYAKAFLQYPDGKSANFATGAYLHHLTMAVVGPGREDLACPGGTERIAKGMERMLAIHNDRNETFYGVTATDKMGFYLGKEDTLDLELLLKNEANKHQEVTFSIEWEFVPGRPAGYQKVKGLWADVAPCSAMMSDIAPPAGKSKFSLTGPSWTSTVDGTFLNTVGHMHDGGVWVKLAINDKDVCTSKAEYNTNPDYISDPKSKHISRYTPCIAIGEVKKGDKVALSAGYDFDTYAPLYDKVGAKSHVMGLAMVFVAMNPQK